MTGRERTLRAIEFRNPDRIPMCLSIDHDYPENEELDYHINSLYQSDMKITQNRNPNFIPPREGEDQWGCLWKTMGHTMGEVVDNPLADWESFDRWEAEQVPDFSDPKRYEASRTMREEYPDLFLMGGLGFMMMDLINFRGYANFMTDLLLEREKLDKLIDVIYRCADDQIERYADIGADAVIAWEDWGLQDRCMISPELWREVFKEKMGRMVEHIHRRGMKYILHCCGHTLDIFEDFIELGIDVIQLDQQRDMGLEALSQYAGRICFFNPGDIQFTSNNENSREVEAYCTEMAKKLSTPEGGFMYKVYSQPLSCSIPKTAVEAECRAFSRFSFY